jgi:mannosyltransferase
MKRSAPGLVLVAVAAVVLRAVSLAGRPIWYDDAFSMLLARGSLPEIVRGTAADTMPPLYYFLLHAWRSVTASVAGARSLNVILSLGVVAAALVLASTLFGRRAGFWAALLTAVSPLQIYQAQEIRMYVILCLALAVYLWGILAAWKGTRGGAMPWLTVIGAGAAAMYSHNLAVFSLAAPTVYFLAARHWKFLKKLLMAQAAIGLLAVPWFLNLPGQIAKIQAAFWTPRPGLLEVVQALLLMHGFLPLPPAATAALLLVSLLAVGFTLLTIARSGWSKEVAFVVTVMVVPPAGLFLVSYVMRPVFVPRAFMLSGLAYLILAAHAIASARAAPIRLALAGCFLGAAALSLPYQYAFEGFPRSPFPAAAAYLFDHSESADVVVHDNKLSYFPMHVYAPSLDQRFLADEPGSHNDTLAPETQVALGLFPAASLEEATQGEGRIFFVVFQRAIDEYKALGLRDHPLLVTLQETYTRAAKTAFSDLLVYEFVR